MGRPRDSDDRPAVIAPLLSGLGKELRHQVVDACVGRRFRRGEALFRQGDPGDCVYLVTDGFLLIQVTTPLGEVATVNVIGAPDTVGELALLEDSGRRSASVVAITPVETLVLGRDAFDRVRAEHPAVEHMLVTIFSAHVRRLSARLTEALCVPADTRVLLRLADLCELFGRGSTPTVIPLTQSDLATMAGTTRPTVNRAVRAAESAGAISLGRGRIEVVEPEVLRKLAGAMTGL